METLNMNTTIVIKALEEFIAKRENEKVSLGAVLDANFARKEIARIARFKSFTSVEALNIGGSWLGTTREWMKANYHNGERVTFGSQELLEGPNPLRTPSDVDWLAAKIAASTLRCVFN
jgi:hypothetical protein